MGRRSSHTAPPAHQQFRDGLVCLTIEVDPLAQPSVHPVFLGEDFSTAHNPSGRPHRAQRPSKLFGSQPT
ncbi:hypothetical protein ROP_pROB02-00540 (plasmid) [Rhodococcus opacus B4]|uniref:Uncharacterized protein n=1 Tax=Rhodococcus opacus (strain B4) TaxID=632772 RepID=C1BDL4_RHOOB|nr:hypothetical protein ROP_pROB02-00540 [Rhodococcus opacus B4]